jgi:hypothetical protein
MASLSRGKFPYRTEFVNLCYLKNVYYCISNLLVRIIFQYSPKLLMHGEL